MAWFRGPLRPVTRTLLRGFVLVLWVFVVALVLEVFAYGRWYWIDYHNRFVKAYQEDFQFWKRLDIDAQGKGIREGMQEFLVPEPFVNLPVPSSEDDHLGTLLASLSEEDRATYAMLNERFIVLYDRSSNNTGVYGSVRTTYFPELTIEQVQGKPLDQMPMVRGAQDAQAFVKQVMETGKPGKLAYKATVSFGQFSTEVACYPLRDPSGAVTAVAAVWGNTGDLTFTETIARDYKKDTPTAMWKRTWVEYQKNAKLSRWWFTNNAGFRDDDVVLPKPKNVFRIACVGGSTTEEGFTNDRTYPNLLEKRLREHFPNGPAIEVINCGVVGLDSLQERRRALDYVRLEPDLIIEYGAVNDLCHGLLPMWEKDAPFWRRILRQSKFVTFYLNRVLWPSDAEASTQLDATVMRNLTMMHDVFKKHGIEMAVCSFVHPSVPWLSFAERDYFEWDVRGFWQGRYFTLDTYCRLVNVYNRRLEEVCTEQGMRYLPLAERMHGGIEYFNDICHMRPKGIQAKADALYDLLVPYLEERFKAAPAST